jgi:copper chaperone CopZ
MTFQELDLTAYLKGKRRHPFYMESVDHAMDMSVHINGTKPFKLLNRVRPREDPDVKKYRLESYEPITTAAADKAMVTTQKIMNPKLWTIKFPESGQDLEQYLFTNYPFYGNLMTYVNDAIIRCMMADPNGLLAVLPLSMEITDAQQVQPIVSVIKSAQVWDYEFGKWYLFHHKTEKDKDGRQVNIFYYVDGVEVVHFKTVTETDRIATYIISTYVHNIGEPPVWPLAGIIKEVDYTGALYRSYFSAALPHWNKAVTSDSDLDGAFSLHMHPIRVELTEDCDFVYRNNRCVGGKVAVENSSVDSMTCPGCAGTGRKSVKSPYGVYQVMKSPLGEQSSSIQPVSYVDIPTEPTKMLVERVQQQIDKGLAALNMFFEIGADQSGIAKAMDRSELYDFLLTVSTTVFDTHITSIIYYTNSYLYMNKGVDKLPIIQKPVSFDLLSVGEEAVALNAATTANLDPTYLKAKQLNFARKDLFGKTLELAMVEDSLILNPFSGVSGDQVTANFNAGLISERDATVSLNIANFIVDAYAANPNFHELTFDEKETVMTQMAEEVGGSVVLPNPVGV